MQYFFAPRRNFMRRRNVAPDAPSGIPQSAMKSPGVGRCIVCMAFHDAGRRRRPLLDTTWLTHYALQGILTTEDTEGHRGLLYPVITIYHALNAIAQMDNIEVDQQPHRIPLRRRYESSCAWWIGWIASVDFTSTTTRFSTTKSMRYPASSLQPS
jgi:hypothetical protein